VRAESAREGRARCPQPARRRRADTRRKLAPEQIADPLALTVGQTGAAHAALVLANVLAGAKPGDRILVASAGDGADAIVLHVTDRAATYKQARSVGRLIESKGDVAYARYLKWREILPTEPPRRPDPERPAGPPMLRSGDLEVRLHRQPSAPRAALRSCRRSASASSVAPATDGALPLRRSPAKVATFTLDRLAYSLNPPTVNVVVDFAGGGRFLCEMTDCEPEKVAIGDEVETTFRRSTARAASTTISGSAVRGAERRPIMSSNGIKDRVAIVGMGCTQFGEHWDKGPTIS
jgi:hypothetical protein